MSVRASKASNQSQSRSEGTSRRRRRRSDGRTCNLTAERSLLLGGSSHSLHALSDLIRARIEWTEVSQVGRDDDVELARKRETVAKLQCPVRRERTAALTAKNLATHLVKRVRKDELGQLLRGRAARRREEG